VAVAAAVGLVLTKAGAGGDDRDAASGSAATTRRDPTGSTSTEAVPSSSGGRAVGFLATAAELGSVASRASAGEEPWASAVRDLLREADEAASRRPRPVDPLAIEGTTGAFVDDTADAYTLALAFGITHDQRYAEASARFVDAWVEGTTETEGTCTDDGSCNTSLIIGRVAPAFVFAADLLDGSAAFDGVAENRFRAWLRDVIVPTASERTNNWGDAGTFLRLTATSYLGDDRGFADAVAAWKERADLIAADGEIPEETRRGRKGLQYSQEALLYKVASARIAERRGVDLWGYRGESGGSVEAALDLVAAAFDRPASWRWHDDVEVPDPAPLWELAAAHWPKVTYRRLAEAGRPFGPDGHSAIRWTTIAGGAPSA
jgi:hypothetical protein